MEIINNKQELKIVWKTKINTYTQKRENKSGGVSEYVTHYVTFPRALLKMWGLSKGDSLYFYERAGKVFVTPAELKNGKGKKIKLMANNHVTVPRFFFGVPDGFGFMVLVCDLLLEDHVGGGRGLVGVSLL